jgi:hypothetical protein
MMSNILDKLYQLICMAGTKSSLQPLPKNCYSHFLGQMNLLFANHLKKRQDTKLLNRNFIFAPLWNQRFHTSFFAIPMQKPEGGSRGSGVVIPIIANIITTPYFKLKPSVGRFRYGSLVGSNSATVIAVTFIVTLFIFVRTFCNYISLFQISTQYSFFIVSFCCKFSLTHINTIRLFILTANALYSIGSLHQ